LDNTWFHIGHNPAEDRYLHCGLISHGYVTVRPLIVKRGDPRLRGRTDVELGLPMPVPTPPAASWDDLYAYLISARKGDGKSVGIITIVD
jgi:hypothetical protein